MIANPLLDKHNRLHHYLRISVTDHCNLKCVYCMPEDGVPFTPHDQLLSNDEITQVVRVLAARGVTNLRITGGEPLVRPNLTELISTLSNIKGIEDIALSTNGIFLAKHARELKRAGITRVNISLDSLRADRFKQITRGGDVNAVLEALRASIEVGFQPIKLNVVLIKGMNDDEIVDFLRLTKDLPITVRFIEYMPIGHADDTWRNRYLPLSTVLDVCNQHGWNYIRSGAIKGNGPSENYQIESFAGTFGLIHPISDHFCESCNRLRLLADGNIKACLFWSDEFNVRKHIGNDEAISNLFDRALDRKPLNHEMALELVKEQLSHTPTVRRMSQIGG